MRRETAAGERGRAQSAPARLGAGLPAGGGGACARGGRGLGRVCFPFPACVSVTPVPGRVPLSGAPDGPARVPHGAPRRRENHSDPEGQRGVEVLRGARGWLLHAGSPARREADRVRRGHAVRAAGASVQSGGSAPARNTGVPGRAVRGGPDLLRAAGASGLRRSCGRRQRPGPEGVRHRRGGEDGALQPALLAGRAAGPGRPGHRGPGHYPGAQGAAAGLRGGDPEPSGRAGGQRHQGKQEPPLAGHSEERAELREVSPGWARPPIRPAAPPARPALRPPWAPGKACSWFPLGVRGRGGPSCGLRAVYFLCSRASDWGAFRDEEGPRTRWEPPARPVRPVDVRGRWWRGGGAASAVLHFTEENPRRTWCSRKGGLI